MLAIGPAHPMLGDLGADVIHGEGPDRPDLTRHLLQVYGMSVMLPHGRAVSTMMTITATRGP